MTPLLLLAAGGAAVYFYLQSKAGTPPDSSGAPPQPGSAPATSGSQVTVSKPAPPQEVAGPLTLPPGRWGWPVPKWQDRAPVISDGFRKPRRDHNGVDIMFARLASDPFRVGSPNGTKSFVMPDSWMAVAASDGYLWSAERTSRGFAVVLDHQRVATFYTHLEALFVPEIKPPSQREPGVKDIWIKAGQPLGVIGADPLDKEGIKHLHFELWRGVNDAVDPAPFLAGWEVFTAKEVSAFMPILPRNAKGSARGRNPISCTSPTTGEPSPGAPRAPDVAPSLITTTHDGAARRAALRQESFPCPTCLIPLSPVTRLRRPRRASTTAPRAQRRCCTTSNRPRRFRSRDRPQRPRRMHSWSWSAAAWLPMQIPPRAPQHARSAIASCMRSVRSRRLPARPRLRRLRVRPRWPRFPDSPAPLFRSSRPPVPAMPTSPLAQMVGVLRNMPADQLLDLAIQRLRAALPKGATVTESKGIQFQLVPVPPSGDKR